MEYPHSRFADLSNDDLTDMARVWADSMKAVPADQIYPLYERLNASYRSDFPPSVGNFRKVWNDESYDPFADANSESEAKREPVIAFGVLPPAPADTSGAGWNGLVMQFEHLRKRGHFFCCTCKNDCGNFVPVLLTADKQNWICETGLCDFRKPVEAIREHYRVQVPEQVVVNTEKPKRLLSIVEKTEIACNVFMEDIAENDPQGALDFRRWAEWYHDTYSADEPVNYERYVATWPIWLEIQAMKRERAA